MEGRRWKVKDVQPLSVGWGGSGGGSETGARAGPGSWAKRLQRFGIRPPGLSHPPSFFHLLPSTSHLPAPTRYSILDSRFSMLGWLRLPAVLVMIVLF